MNTNMPILYDNILFSLPEGRAHDAFLWAAEQDGNDRYLYRAEAFAREVALLASDLGTLIDASFRILSEQQPSKIAGEDMRSDLLRFLLTRHANWRWGGNKAPSYCTENKA